MTKEVYTVETLAERWLCSQDVIYNLLQKRKLKGFKVGTSWRITAQAVSAYENNNEEETQ